MSFLLPCVPCVFLSLVRAAVHVLQRHMRCVQKRYVDRRPAQSGVHKTGWKPQKSLIVTLCLQVGPRTLAGWFYHYFALVYYTAMHTLLTPVRAVVRGNNSGVINSSAPARSSPPLDDDPL
eukprot:scaffold102661_cov27-Tisochrysis_lutea.AAC.1